MTLPTLPTPPHLATPVPARVESADGYQAHFDAMMLGFLEESVDGQADLGRELYGHERKIGYKVDERWVATTDSATRTMSVPGGSLEVNAVTAVTVASGYRRRGLLRGMMHQQLAETTEPAALLWASEAAIYGRFGYGELTSRLVISGRTTDLAFAPEVDTGTGSVDEVDATTWTDAAARIRSELLPHRPGWLQRDEAWWKVKHFDPQSWRDGATAYRYVLHFNSSGQADGYGQFRIKEDTATWGPDSEVQINELEAVTPQGYAKLWAYLRDMDLVGKFRQRTAAADCPLPLMLSNTRGVQSSVGDGTYLRILDVPATLSARTYPSDLDVVFELRDPVIDANNRAWALRISNGKADISPTQRTADLVLSSRDLGAIYLGKTTPADLVRASRITLTDAALGQAVGLAFSTSRAPHCSDPF